MSTLVTPRPTTVDDGPAIAELRRLHTLQDAAFRAAPYPDIEERRGHLMALAAWSWPTGTKSAGDERRLRGAPELFTDLVEVLGIAGRAAYADPAGRPLQRP